MNPQPFYLQFFNIQYWYCVIYSIFGGKCTNVNSVQPTVNISSATPNVNVPTVQPGFWDWLFGGQGSAVANAPHTGLLGPLVDILAPVVAVIGAILSFIWNLYSVLAYTVSGLLLLVIAGALFGLLYVRFQELSLYGSLPPAPSVAHPLQDRWQTLLDGAMTSDPKRWREGILEADTMLGELLTKLGYQGASTAEQIRLVPENAFVTLPLAWEAHRIRNFVSASASNFILMQQEAFRTMKLYEQVFDEFNFV